MHADLRIIPGRASARDASAPYFAAFEARRPPEFPPMNATRERIWHLLAGCTAGFGLWYLSWRWTHTLNPEAMAFSITIACAETLVFLGSLLFFFDIWREGDTPAKPPPRHRTDVYLDEDPGAEEIVVDLLVASYDEPRAIVLPTLLDALAVRAPDGCRVNVHLLDDGNRDTMRRLAADLGVGYLCREDNAGFKAGNLKHALLRLSGDFFVVLDADSRTYPTLLENTLGYFRDPDVAWVQTPHWFYDIPEGGPSIRSAMAGGIRWLPARIGALITRPRDPFMADPAMFFDVIQRRRNRHGASFCCGAGWVHRRDAVFDVALTEVALDLDRTARRAGCPSSRAGLTRALCLQPFRFHVSEDIFTSILHHRDRRRWRSVYHSRVECRMLSPQTIEAWRVQQMKYAGGTLDILARANPLGRGAMPIRTRLHYAATFWSYLATIWTVVLLFAPAFSLVTGLAPVKAYSAEFFLHLLPVLLLNEFAMIAASKNHDFNRGRILAIAGVPIVLRAAWMVLRGKRPSFPTTPKLPVAGRVIWPIASHLGILALMIGAAVWGIAAAATGSEAHSASFMAVNLFWIAWNAAAILRLVLAAAAPAPQASRGAARDAPVPDVPDRASGPLHTFSIGGVSPHGAH